MTFPDASGEVTVCGAQFTARSRTGSAAGLPARGHGGHMSMAYNPLVSVVICTYNSGSYLREAVQSILDQTYRHLEVIVVDDGSTDGSVDEVRRACPAGPVRWIRQENAGKAVALNRALAEIRGEFLVIQDGDDVSHPLRVERQLERMLSDEKLGAVFCGHDLILDGRHVAPRMREKSPDECRRDIEAFRMPAHDPTVMYRTACIRDIPFEPSLRIGQVFDHVLRVGERWPMAVVGQCLYSYRIHRASVTRRVPEVREKYVREVLCRACQRRGLCFETLFKHWNLEASLGKPRVRDNNLAAHFMESAIDQRRERHFWAAVRTGFECARLAPLSFHYHKAWIYALSPYWLVRRIRSRN